MRISDWSSDVCSSDLFRSPQTLPSPRTCSGVQRAAREDATAPIPSMLHIELKIIVNIPIGTTQQKTSVPPLFQKNKYDTQCFTLNASRNCFSDGSLSNGSELEGHRHRHRSKEHTYELQSLMRIQYA